jgi:tetratricopeptide (TPR) repeat protein
MKDDPQHRPRRPDDASTTVIHHYEEDDTLLASWLRKGLDQGPKFWLLLGGSVALAVLIGLLINKLSTSESSSSSAWTELMLAKGVNDLKKVADERPDSPVAGWALLRAAEARYREGFDDLPSNREAAMPLLKQALDLFQQAEQDSPKDSPQKRMAALGTARTYEARNELDSAIKQYETVASTYPGADEAKLAEAQAKVLKDPQSAQFYREFYAFKPKDVTLPPRGSSLFNIPGMPTPGLDRPGGLDLPPIFGPDTPSSAPSTAPRTGGGELPGNVFENPAPPAPTPPASSGAAPVEKPAVVPSKAPTPDAAPKPKS